MSGPIIRKYGFPNFEKIFGERPLEHGIDEEEPSVEQVEEPSVEQAKQAGPAESTKKTSTKKKSTKSKKE